MAISSIAAQGKKMPLSEYLNALEEQFLIYFIYEDQLLDPYQVSSDISSNKSLEYKLDLALRETSLAYKKLSPKTYAIIVDNEFSKIFGMVYDSNRRPLAGATVQARGCNLGTVSNIHGEYSLQVPPGKFLLECRYVNHEKSEKYLDLLDGEAAEIDFELADLPPLDQVIVVGSKLNAQKLLESPMAASSISPQNSYFSHAPALGELLQRSIPSFHSTHQTISDGTDHIDPTTLKGLGSDQLLILVNGKRRHHSALVNINGTIGRGSVSTDLNAIPVAAIDRIEILKDGAATTYGSDAIAGVINVVLKESTSFLELNSQSGISASGDGLSTSVEGNYGMHTKKSGAYINGTFEFRQRSQIDRSGNYTGPIFKDNRDKDSLITKAFYDNIPLKDQHVMPLGRAASVNANLFLNMGMPISKDISLYAFGGLSYKFGKSGTFYRFPYEKEKQSGIYSQGFSPKIHSDIIDQSAAIGVRGLRNHWNFDLSNSFGSNLFRFTVSESNNASMGLSSPSTVEAGSFSYQQNVINLDIKRQFKGKIPIKTGFGFESRVENYKIIAGDEASWQNYGDTTDTGAPKEGGFQGFIGLKPENELQKYRLNFGSYADIELKVLPFLLVGMATRGEYYSDFGSNLSWRAYSRVKINKYNYFRSSINTGFRAPSLPQLYFNSTTIQFINQDQSQVSQAVSHFNSENPLLRQFGVKELRPEKSLNFSLGYNATIARKISLTADTYLIDIQNRTAISGRFSANDPDFSSILQPVNTSKAQFFTNAVDTRTLGIEMSVNYHIKYNKLDLKFNLGGSWNQTRIKRNEDGELIIHSSDILAEHKDILFNREEISRMESVQPQSKILFGTRLIRKNFSATLNLTRIGSALYIHPEDGDPENWVYNQISEQIESRDQIFSAKYLTDLSIQYRVGQTFSVAIGGNNVFNVFPDQHMHSANVSDGLFTYSRRVSQFGLMGAYWYARVGLKI